jgi:putative oxidoreductase
MVPYGRLCARVGYMRAAGVPGALLPLAIITELGGGLALVLGWRSRLISILLAAYSILAALLFDMNFAEQVQAVMFLKNISIAGGMLVLAVNGGKVQPRCAKNLPA